METKGRRVAKKKVSPKEVVVQPEAPSLTPELLKHIEKAQTESRAQDSYDWLMMSNRRARICGVMRDRCARQAVAAAKRKDFEEVKRCHERAAVLKLVSTYYVLMNRVGLPSGTEEDLVEVTKVEAELKAIQWKEVKDPEEFRKAFFSQEKFIEDSVAEGHITKQEVEWLLAGLSETGGALFNGDFKSLTRKPRKGAPSNG